MKISTPNFGTVEIVNFIDLSENGVIEVLNLRNHPDVRSQMHNSDIITEAEHFEFVESLKLDAYKKYFVVSVENKIIGVIYFTDINLTKGYTTFGIYANLVNKALKSGSILMETAIKYLKSYMDCKVIRLEVFDDNERALNLYAKYDFVKKGKNKNVIHMELGKL